MPLLYAQRALISTGRQRLDQEGSLAVSVPNLCPIDFYRELMGMVMSGLNCCAVAGWIP